MPTKGRPQIAVRCDPKEANELEALARIASTPLRRITRSDVMRRAFELGREAIRLEIGATRAEVDAALAAIEAGK